MYSTGNSRLGIASVITLLVSVPTAAAEPTFEERLEGRRAVEEVYWQHRSWPAGEAAVKPALDRVLPEATLRRRVEDSLRLTSALASFWQRPLTDEDLQTELDRIVRETAAPELLEELFAALDNDARRVAESLVRPVLARRLARELYAADERLHGALRREAENEAARANLPGDLGVLSGEYRERVWLEYGDGVTKGELLAGPDGATAVVLSPGELEGMVADLDRRFGGPAAAGQVGPLEEDAEAFRVSAVLERGERCLRLATVSWRKRDFDDWWGEARARFPASPPPASGQLRLAAVEGPPRVPNSWTTLTATDAPSARSRHTAVSDGTRIMVWGGEQSGGVSYGGAIYDFATSSWSAMTNTGHPDARMDHTAAWTGTEMIVWGGMGASSLLATGGRYDPTADSWTLLPTTGAPAARRYHVMGFSAPSGTLFVWGGHDGGSVLGDGAKYTISGGWSILPTTGSPPSARMDAGGVVWPDTNPYLVVWGGEGASGVLGEGARFSTYNNTWFALPASGAPSQRTDHSMVLLGGLGNQEDWRIVVWGGFNGSNTVTSGAMLETPYASSWTATNTSGAPAGRQGHLALVGDDFTMVVWGGFAGATLRDTGGVYNPYNRVWRATATTGAPSGRKWHAGTGDRIYPDRKVIWGGWDGTFSATGAEYEQPSDFLVRGRSLPDSISGGTEFVTDRWDVMTQAGFPDAVTLSCTGLSGSCLFAPNPVTGGAMNIDGQISVGNVPTGTLQFNITGTSGAVTRNLPVSMTIRDFTVICDAIVAPPNSSATAVCSISSLYGFADEVTLGCNSAPCTFDPPAVTPSAGGSATTVLTLEVGPTSYLERVLGLSHNTSRFYDLPVTVDQSAVFSDGFEQGNTLAWSSTVP